MFLITDTAAEDLRNSKYNALYTSAKKSAVLQIAGIDAGCAEYQQSMAVFSDGTVFSSCFAKNRIRQMATLLSVED